MFLSGNLHAAEKPVVNGDLPYEKDTKIYVSTEEDKKIDEYVIVEIFRLIENTPDYNLKNISKKELLEYFNSKSDIIDFKEKSTDRLITTFGWWENTKCGAAIVLVVGGTFFIGTKLLKLKKYIKALGGAKEAAYLVYLYFHYGKIPKEAVKNAGKFILGLAEMVLGIDVIKNECGHLFGYKHNTSTVLC